MKQVFIKQSFGLGCIASLLLSTMIGAMEKEEVVERVKKQPKSYLVRSLSCSDIANGAQNQLQNQAIVELQEQQRNQAMLVNQTRMLFMSLKKDAAKDRKENKENLTKIIEIVMRNNVELKACVESQEKRIKELENQKSSCRCKININGSSHLNEKDDINDEVKYSDEFLDLQKKLAEASLYCTGIKRVNKENNRADEEQDYSLGTPTASLLVPFVSESKKAPEEYSDKVLELQMKLNYPLEK